MKPPRTLIHKLRRLANAERLRKIILRLPDAEVFLVGGAVRDLLLKRPLGDLDFVVRGVPLPKLQRWLAKFGEVNFVGKNFGVLKFKPRGSRTDVDVALPRTEHAFGTGGTRDVDVRFDAKLPLTDDLQRRDFTVNALAANLQTGLLTDSGTGLADLGARKLRAVGRPADRFQEDFSRILRGLRLAVELGFDFEDRTWRAMKTLVPNLASTVVPRELVAKEFLKAFSADPLKVIDLWDLAGAFRAVMPEVLAMHGCPQPPEFHSEGDVWTHARLSVEKALSPAFKKAFRHPARLETLLAMFLHDVGKPATLQTPAEHGTDRIRTSGHDVEGALIARTLAERLHLSSHEGLVDSDRLEWLVRNHMIALAAQDMRPSTLERYFLIERERGDELLKLIWADSAATINRNGQPAFGALTTLRQRLKKLTPRQTPAKPLVRGDELMQVLSLPSGPIVGRLLTMLRDAQLEKKIRTRRDAFKLAKQIIDRQRHD